MVWGNPWHGKLAAGTIELEAGTPVSSITFEGDTWAVPSVSGILGDTRYYCRPPYPGVEPITPADIAALHGSFKRDFVLYSSSRLYSPLDNNAILSPDEFMFWDIAADRWRKMQGFFPENWFPGYTTRPPAGTVISTWTVKRGQVYGEFNRGTVTPSWSTIGSGSLVYSDKFNPFRVAATGNGWDWLVPCTTSFDVSRDGKSILVLLTAWPEGSYPSPVAGAERIANVWQTTINDAGTAVGALTELLPTPVDSVLSWTASHAGAPYLLTWTEGAVAHYAYLQPVNVTYSGHAENAVSWRIIAGHDKNGTAKVMYLRDVNNRNLTGAISGGAWLGFGMSGTYDPEGPPLADPPAEVPGFPPMPGAGTYTFTGGVASGEYMGVVADPAAYFNINQLSATGSFTDTVDRALRIVDESGTVIHEWTDSGMLADFPLALSWKRLTNNVASIELGGQSIARVGPGAVDATVMSLPVYATFDHRAGVVHSSASPVGIV